MTTDMPSPPTHPSYEAFGPQFNPPEKLIETKTCILCSAEEFLGGTLLSDREGSVQNKTVCMWSDAQIYP